MVISTESPVHITAARVFSLAVLGLAALASVELATEEANVLSPGSVMVVTLVPVVPVVTGVTGVTGVLPVLSLGGPRLAVPLVGPVLGSVLVIRPIFGLALPSLGPDW